MGVIDALHIFFPEFKHLTKVELKNLFVTMKVSHSEELQPQVSWSELCLELKRGGPKDLS